MNKVRTNCTYRKKTTITKLSYYYLYGNKYTRSEFRGYYGRRGVCHRHIRRYVYVCVCVYLRKTRNMAVYLFDCCPAL